MYTCDWFRGLLELLTIGVLQQLNLLKDLGGLEIADTDGFFSSIDIVTSNHRMLSRSWRYNNLDFGMPRRKVFEMCFDIGTMLSLVSPGHSKLSSRSLHASAASSPVTICEVYPLAGQNERANAILIASVEDYNSRAHDSPAPC